jgi:hypothetical protein
MQTIAENVFKLQNMKIFYFPKESTRLFLLFHFGLLLLPFLFISLSLQIFDININHQATDFHLNRGYYEHYLNNNNSCIGKSEYEKPPGKYAIIISGGSRTFYLTWPSIYETWIKGKDVDIFIDVNLPEQPSANDCAQFHMPLATNKVRYLRVRNLTKPIVMNLSTPYIPNFPYLNVPHSGWKERDDIVVQYYGHFIAYIGFLSSKPVDHHYELVVRIRADGIFDNFSNPTMDYEKLANEIDSNGHLYASSHYLWYSPGHWPDIFAIMTEKTAFFFYEQLTFLDVACHEDEIPMVPEGILYYILFTRNGINFTDLESLFGMGGDFQFGILRSANNIHGSMQVFRLS